MPLPAPNTPFPPPAHVKAYRDFDVWDAWYSGDLDRLFDVYKPASRGGYDTRAQRSDGAVGKAARWFLGTPPREGERVSKLHIPAAGDLATTWADLMFGQPPRVTSKNKATAERLDELFDEDTWAQLHEAAQAQAPFGGVYVTVGFDRDLDATRPLFFVNHADNAIPRFAGRRLAEVTFHTVVEHRDGQVLRHLEHHAPRAVQHALYLGTGDNLGRQIPLTEASHLEHLLPLLAEDGQTIETRLPVLDTVYVRLRPTKKWRRDGELRRLGGSLYSGIEPAMDALDETYSSWMRDIRLAKARLLVPASYLQNNGPGQGATFDQDREVFTSLNSLTKEAMSITPNQFKIRFAEHQGTATELWEQVVTGAGFAAQTFGITGEAAMTAAESWARERKTHYTRGGGIRYWTLGLRDLADLMLLVDREEFSGTAPLEEAEIEFPPLVADQPQQRAETALAMRNAKGASTATIVRMLHPEWEDDAINEEVALIDGDTSDDPDLDDPLADVDALLAANRGPATGQADGDDT